MIEQIGAAELEELLMAKVDIYPNRMPMGNDVVIIKNSLTFENSKGRTVLLVSAGIAHKLYQELREFNSDVRLDPKEPMPDPARYKFKERLR